MGLWLSQVTLSLFYLFQQNINKILRFNSFVEVHSNDQKKKKNPALIQIEKHTAIIPRQCVGGLVLVGDFVSFFVKKVRERNFWWRFEALFFVGVAKVSIAKSEDTEFFSPRNA